MISQVNQTSNLQKAVTTKVRNVVENVSCRSSSSDKFAKLFISYIKVVFHLIHR